MRSCRLRAPHWFLLLSLAMAQVPRLSAQVSATADSTHGLVLKKTITVKSEPARGFPLPLQCDGSGNAYLLHRNGRGEPPFEIRKFDPQGKPGPLFSTSSIPDFQVQLATYFSVADDGSIYQVAFPLKDKSRYIVAFNADGSFKAKIQLKAGFPWMAEQVAPFPSGDLLVAGTKDELDEEGHYRNMVPFTGIFSRDGTLIKTVVLPDDDEIGRRSEAGDIDVVEGNYPHHIKSIVHGGVLAASDGNIYLMRRLSPAVFYAISPSGKVIKSFKIETDDPDFVVFSAHTSENRIAVQLVNFEKNRVSFRIYDFQGRQLRTYSAPEESNSGLGFVCYSTKDDQFTFLGPTDSNDSLSFEVASPK
jgi:hypothetical protein